MALLATQGIHRLLQKGERFVDCIGFLHTHRDAHHVTQHPISIARLQPLVKCASEYVLPEERYQMFAFFY